MKKYLCLIVLLMLFITSGCDFNLSSGVTTTKIEASEKSTLEFTMGNVDITKIILKTTLSNGKEKDVVVYKSMISETDLKKLESAGEHEITITYQKLTTKVIIKVIEIKTEKIEISENSILAFKINSFDISKLKLKITKTDLKTSEVVVTDKMISQIDLDKLKEEGQHEITINYDSLNVKVTITIIKEIVKAEVKFVTNNDQTITSKTVDTLSTITEPTSLTKEGYEFDGWYLEPTFVTKWNFSTSKVPSDITLYAKWNIKKFTIKFVVDGYEDIIKEVEYGKTLTDIPSIPYKKGYIGSWEEIDLTNIKANKTVNATYKVDDTFIDDYFLSMTFDENIESVEELAVLLDYIKFNEIETYNVKINFEFDDLQQLTDDSMNLSKLDLSANFHFSMTGNDLIITSTFSSKASESADTINRQTQTECVENLSQSTRSSSYNSFKINSVSKTYNVKTSDQLYFVLEKGYRPVFNEQNTTAERLYNKAKDILRTIISDTDSDVEKLHKIYHYIIMNVTYDSTLFNGVLQNGGSGLSRYKGFYLEGVFDDKRAVCDGISKAFTVLANIEGITCVRVVGKAINGGYGHAWNKVKIEGAWYVIDATGGGLIVGSEKEVLVHNLFMISDQEMAKKYIAETYKEFVASSNYNIYKYMTFTYKDKTYDFDITSQEELNTIIEYYVSLNKNTQTIDFLIDFDYGTDFNDELNTALQKTKVSSYSQMIIDKVFVFNGFTLR